MYGDTNSAWYTSGNYTNGASISLGTTGGTTITGNGVFQKTGSGILYSAATPATAQRET